MILTFSLWRASKPLRDIFLKALVCCAVLLLISVAGAVLLVNHLLVAAGVIAEKRPATRDRFG